MLHAHMISQHRRIREARREANLRASTLAALAVRNTKPKVAAAQGLLLPSVSSTAPEVDPEQDGISTSRESMSSPQTANAIVSSSLSGQPTEQKVSKIGEAPTWQKRRVQRRKDESLGIGIF